MATPDTDLDAIEAAASKNAQRGASDMSIGDRRVTFTDPLKLLAAKRALDNEDSGGIYQAVPSKKGYF